MQADVIQFELSPRGNSNSLKFAHEHLLNQFFIDQNRSKIVFRLFLHFIKMRRYRSSRSTLYLIEVDSNMLYTVEGRLE